MLDGILTVAGQFAENPYNIAANTIFTFTVAGESEPVLEFDSVGNPVIKESDSVAVSLSAYLRQKKRPYADVQEGANLEAEYFEGRLVNPKTYPFPIRSLGDIQVIINGRNGAVTQLNCLESPASEQFAIASKLGQRIKCYVRFEQGN